MAFLPVQNSPENNSIPLFLFNLDKKTKTLISGTPRSAFYRQGGLLDVAVQKRKDGNYIFLCYSKLTANKNLTVAISKSKLLVNKLIKTRDIFTSNHLSKSGVHFGCRLALNDFHLFASLGDRGDRTNAQNPNNHPGSIIKIPLHGKTTTGNLGWLPEIYSIGHRNPQGLHFQKSTGQLWSHEHGPRGGDEINIINKNNNLQIIKGYINDLIEDCDFTEDIKKKLYTIYSKKIQPLSGHLKYL